MSEDYGDDTGRGAHVSDRLETIPETGLRTVLEAGDGGERRGGGFDLTACGEGGCWRECADGGGVIHGERCMVNKKKVD